MQTVQSPATSRLRLSPLAACLGAVIALGSVVPCANAGSAQPNAAWPFQRHVSNAGPVPEGLRQRAAASRASRHDSPSPHGGLLLPVTSCADDGGAGTLRHEALVASSGDTLDLSGLTCSTITLESGAVNIDVEDLTVMGPGAAALAIVGDGSDRVFRHGGTGTLELSYLTVTNGNYTVVTGVGYGGGCVYSKGTISLTDAVVSSCTATGDTVAVGGGMLARDGIVMSGSTIKDSKAIALTGAAGAAVIAGGAFAVYSFFLEHSTISGNSVTTPFGKAYAGGIFASGSVTAKYSTVTGNSGTTGNASGSGYYAFGGGLVAKDPIIQNCTIDNNSADAAAGVYLLTNDVSYSALITNTTISGNHAVLAAGGMFSEGDLRLRNSTIAFNVGGSAGGGGLIVGGTTTDLESNIIADNSPSGVSGAADFDGSSTVTGANNLIKIAGATITVPPDTITQDPQLGPLTANGGETRTHAIPATSPAFDTGNNSAGSLYDQRGPGFAREVGASADIGAYELNADIIFVDGFDVGG
jgi:hypothetical protein